MSRTIRKRTVALASAALLAFASTTLGTTAASATDAPAAPDPTVDAAYAADGSVTFTSDDMALTVEQPEGPAPSDAALQAMAPVASCTLSVHHVHASTHVNGTINVTSTITCTVNMGSLRLQTSLDQLGVNKRWPGLPKSNTTRNNIEANASTTCGAAPGTFRGFAQGVVVPLPGYTLLSPPTHSEYGPALYVTCQPRSSAAPDETVSEYTFDLVRTDLVSEYTP